MRCRRYQLGLHEGWMPTDYSAISGACAYQAEELGTEPPETVDWTPPLSAWMTGGEGAGTITAETSEYEWPPASMKNIQVIRKCYFAWRMI